MTVEQIRQALDYMEQNYGLALDAGDYSLAQAFLDKITWLRGELERQVTV